MKRREFIAFGGTFLLSPRAAFGQVPGRTYRIGSLHSATRNAPHHVALLEELNRAGFVQGQNLVVDADGYGLRQEQFLAHASGLASAKVDLILCAGDRAIREAQAVSAQIPILGVTEDMVGAGLVSSLSKPGANTTGVSILAADLDPKRQELLLEALPTVRRIAALADTNTVAARQLDSLMAGAKSRGVELSIYQVTRIEEIAPAIEKASSAGAAALNVLATPLFFNNRHVIFEGVSALKLPAIYQWPEMAEEGGFIAYGPRIVDIYRKQVSRQMVQLLKGTRPADIPIEQPSMFELVVNGKAANSLGLVVSASILNRADKVIE